jgi:hypothetical protein
MIVVLLTGTIMAAFLVITSLSLVFYLALLVFLYRDGRKRRPSGGSVYKVQAGSAAETGPLLAMVYAGPSPHRRNAARVLVRFAENSGRGSIKSRASQSEPATAILSTTLARDNDDAQCG